MILNLLKIILQDFGDAAEGLYRQPFRFILSGIGIGIGVSALVGMLSISEGAKQNALQKIESLGVNTLRIETSSSVQTHKSTNLSKGVTKQDLEQIKLMVGSNDIVGGYLKNSGVRVVFKAAHSGTLIAATPGWIHAEDLVLAKGRYLRTIDLERHAQVCLLGRDLALSIQANIGSIVQINNSLSTVVGIFKRKGRLLSEGTGLSSLDFDQVVIIPLTNISLPQNNRDRLDGIIIALSTKKETVVLNTAKNLSRLIQQRHHNVNDYLVVAPLRLLVEVRETQRTFSLVMGVIAGLSLLVGGIGVMNVMLANISEQTREIGLRIAVGATRQRIVGLYLWQSVQLTLLSGIWGLLGGVLISLIIQAYAEWPIAFSALGLLMGPISAIITGILFGLHPALRASAISPSLALREV